MTVRDFGRTLRSVQPHDGGQWDNIHGELSKRVEYAWLEIRRRRHSRMARGFLRSGKSMRRLARNKDVSMADESYSAGLFPASGIQ